MNVKDFFSISFKYSKAWVNYASCSTTAQSPLEARHLTGGRLRWKHRALMVEVGQ
jgi:hypothetical protein